MKIDFKTIPEKTVPEFLGGEKEFNVKTFIDENGNKIPKKIIKGGRLHWYPAGTRIYRCSRNCAKPEVYYTSNEQAEYNTVFDTLTYESTKSIEDTETNFRNIINRRVYNAIL